MARIVHISGDFPDEVNPLKTRAIQSLTALAAERYDQTVYSLNRREPPRTFLARVAARPWKPKLQVEWRAAAGPIVPLVYRAPGWGILHAAMLDQLGEEVADQIARGSRPDLIIGYKLSIEGIVAARAAQRIGVPYGIMIQGNTDQRIVRARPDLSARFGRIFHGASVVFSTTPWALSAMERALGRREGPVLLLPCPTDQDRVLAPRRGMGRLTTAFHLRNYRLKNFARLAGAVAKARRKQADLRLDVIGDGGPEDFKKVAQISASAGEGAILVRGGVDHGAIQAELNSSRGFVLPSRRETFGLVFIEAVLAGCPIAYPKGAAVEGYFDGASFAVAADANSESSIEEAVSRLWRDEARMKRDLETWQADGRLGLFRRDGIRRVFLEGIDLARGRGGRPRDEGAMEA